MLIVFLGVVIYLILEAEVHSALASRVALESAVAL